jgi:hypothetical protein
MIASFQIQPLFDSLRKLDATATVAHENPAKTGDTGDSINGDVQPLASASEIPFESAANTNLRAKWNGVYDAAASTPLTGWLARKRDPIFLPFPMATNWPLPVHARSCGVHQKYFTFFKIVGCRDTPRPIKLVMDISVKSVLTGKPVNDDRIGSATLIGDHGLFPAGLGQNVRLPDCLSHLLFPHGHNRRGLQFESPFAAQKASVGPGAAPLSETPCQGKYFPFDSANVHDRGGHDFEPKENSLCKHSPRTKSTKPHGKWRSTCSQAATSLALGQLRTGRLVASLKVGCRAANGCLTWKTATGGFSIIAKPTNKQFPAQLGWKLGDQIINARVQSWHPGAQKENSWKMTNQAENSQTRRDSRTTSASASAQSTSGCGWASCPIFALSALCVSTSRRARNPSRGMVVNDEESPGTDQGQATVVSGLAPITPRRPDPSPEKRTGVK